MTKLAIFVALKLCGVVVREGDYMLKVPGSITLSSGYDFLFSLFLFFILFFLTITSAV